MNFWENYEKWQQIVLRAYNARFNLDCNIGNVDICEDGSIYEGNLSWAKGFQTWESYYGGLK